MSIELAKKQAKNLRRLLPAFLAEHSEGGKLADFQELIARTHGYISQKTREPLLGEVGEQFAAGCL